MDIQSYIEQDKELLLQWNGSDSIFWDGVIWVATSTYIWVPFALALLYVLFKNKSPKEALLVLTMVALTIALADQIASGICKPFFARFRPTQDPEIMYMVDLVYGYRGGRYGFISSHAANTFGVAVFVSLLMRNKLLSVVLILWALLNAYTRIYLGVHYPGDILFGTLAGSIVGLLVYLLYKKISQRMVVSKRYISSQYTSSGYILSDVYFLVSVFMFTCIIIGIWGMINAHMLQF